MLLVAGNRVRRAGANVGCGCSAPRKAFARCFMMPKDMNKHSHKQGWGQQGADVGSAEVVMVVVMMADSIGMGKFRAS